MFHHIFATGFFSSPVVHTALIVGGAVSVVSAIVGVFTVIRGQSFAGHAFGDIGSTGGSGGFLVGIGALWGFVIAGLAAATAMELVGVQRARGRDLATGIVLGAALGLAALFLYLGTTSSSTTGATMTILFGSVFTIASSTTPLVIALSALSLGVCLAFFRPLLLASVNRDLAAVKRVPVRLIGAIYLFALAITVALAAVTIGSILSTALLIGPAATALRFCRTPARAMVAAATIALATTWAAIVLAYDSYGWPPANHAWPVSFFVVALVLATYLLTGLPSLIRRAVGRSSFTRADGPAFIREASDV